MPTKKQKRFQTKDLLLRTSVAVATAAGAVCLIVSSLLIINYLQVRRIDPLEHPELARLRTQLTGTPETDAQVIEAIRTLDLLARVTFFTSQEQLRVGGMIALIAGIVFVVALRVAASSRARPPEPSAEGPQQYYWTDRARARELLVFMGGLWLLVALLAAAFTRLDIPEPTPDEIAAAIEAADAPAPMRAAPAIPSWDEVKRQWPSFRGPGGYGIAYHTTAPTTWDVETGENILWAADVPLPGTNSPVVWEDRVYVSGANEGRREVYAFDAATGELLWRSPVGARAAPLEKQPQVQDYTGWAAPTLAVQGDCICAIFATGHLACLDGDGAMRWEKHLGVPDNHYGHASSLIIYDELLIVQFDQRTDGALYAFNLHDGVEVWRQERERISWASPVIVDAPDDPKLAVVSTRDLDIYDPRDGTLRWSIDCLGGEVGPSPAYGAGMFFVANEYADASAVRLPEKREAAPDEQGLEQDETADSADEPEIVWQFYEALPDVASPLATDNHYYMLTSRGEIICMNPENGEVQWVHEHDEAFYASPVLVDDRIYALDKSGLMFIFKDADTYEEIAVLALGAPAVATPAFMDRRIYARTEEALLCIGEQSSMMLSTASANHETQTVRKTGTDASAQGETGALSSVLISGQ